MSDIPLRIAAFVAFAALVGGGVFGASQVIGDGDLQLPTAQFATIEAAKSLQPGEAVSYPFELTNDDAETRNFTLAVLFNGGLTVEAPEMLSVPAEGATGGWIVVRAPEDAEPGAHTVKLAITGEGFVTKRLLTVTVLGDDAGAGLGDGDSAVLTYAGRDDVGLFSTNVELLHDSSLPRTEPYNWNPREFSATAGEGSNLIPGLARGILGMVPGESRLVAVAPEDGYGPLMLTTNESRTETLEREFTIPERNESRPIESFAQMLSATGQGTPDDYEPGDTFSVEVPPANTIEATLLTKTEAGVTYRLNYVEGLKLTVYPAWPGMSEVTNVENGTITIRTTPTMAIGESFTYRTEWPDSTSILSLGESDIVLYHTPAVGLTYTAPVSGGGTAEFTVKELTDEEMTLEYRNPRPFAGRTLYFDVTYPVE